MKKELRFDRVDLDMVAAIKKGRLVGTLTAEIEITPDAVARFFNFKKQHTNTNLVIEAPQLVMDLVFEEERDPDMIESGNPVLFTYWDSKVIEGEELPYRCEIDHLRGAGRTPRAAVIAALRAGGVIEPPAEGVDDDPVIVAEALHNKYAPADNPDAAGNFPYLPLVCDVILEDTFDVAELAPPADTVPVTNADAAAGPAPATPPKKGSKKTQAPA